MKLGLLLLVAFFFVYRDAECCSEERCLICRDITCKCEMFGCGDDEKMSLKKLILHFLNKAQRKTDEDAEELEDETLAPLVRVFRDILKRASRLNINEEIAIRDMIICRLRTLEAKCPCIAQSHEIIMKKFLRLLLEKCLECECGIVPCECVWRKKPCEPPKGMYWFRTTDENLRKERPKRECCIKHDEKGVFIRNADFDSNYKCRRFLSDDNEAFCGEFSICTDCDSCQIVAYKTKDEIHLFCDGCRAINSPYVQFTKAGCPMKTTSVGINKNIRIRTRYLQLNDFRLRPSNKTDRSDFECPSLSKLENKKGRWMRK